jgi:hypothetical protein
MEINSILNNKIKKYIKLKNNKKNYPSKSVLTY